MRWAVVCALCLLQGLVLPRQLEAQNAEASRSASARAFFEEGVKFTDAGQWAEAADRFGRALALRDSQVIRYNLANALVELNRLVEASELFRLVEKDPASEQALREESSQRLTTLAPRLARLTIQVEGPAEGASVFLDGHEVAGVQIGVGIPVDPREHTLRCVRNGEETDAQTFALTDGMAETVTLHAVKVPTPEEAAATLAPVMATSPTPVDASERDHKRKRRLWWGIGGGAVAVAVITVVSVLVAGSSRDSAPKTYEGDFDPPSIPVQVGP